MCKRLHSDFAAPSSKYTVSDSKNASFESTHYDKDLVVLQDLFTTTNSLEHIKSGLCGLTNDLHPIFDDKNLCVCKHQEKEYCFVPHKVAELESATEQLEGSLEPTWNHPLGKIMLRSAMQLASRMITHKDTLPFYGGLIDCATETDQDEIRPFRVRPRQRLSAANEKKVLDYLTQAASRIRIHFKSFKSCEAVSGISSDTCSGFCEGFPVWDDDPNYLGKCDPPCSELFCYAWRDGKPVSQAGEFPHIFMKVDNLVSSDKWFSEWQNTTVTDLRASILQFAITLCHEFSHALAAITQNGPRIPRFNDECVVETGFSWEQFVFGGVVVANPSDSTDLWLSPWPSYEGWKSCADSGNTLELCSFSRGALPLQQGYPVESQTWQQFLEQDFWERADTAKGAFKKLWLRGNNAFYNEDHFAVHDTFSASPGEKCQCLDEEGRRRRRVEAIRERRTQAMKDRPDRWDRIVDKAEERREMFHESQGKLLLADFWESCTQHCDQNVFLQ